jgi:hypothetical protein
MRIDIKTLYDNLNRLANNAWNLLPIIVGYVAFASFIAGAVVALTHLTPHAATESSRWQTESLRR